MSAFEQVWEYTWEEVLVTAEGDPQLEVQRIADRSLGELAELYARLGRYDELELLFSEIDRSALSGFAPQRVEAAFDGLKHMRTKPEISFRCGPFALSRILAISGEQHAFPPAIWNSASSRQGFSLSQLEALSTELELGLVPAKRSAAAELLLPAVVHWRSGHYAAILERRDVVEEDTNTGTTAFYRVQDPTFGSEKWLSQEAIDDESSGYFLVPEERLQEPGTSGWARLETGEADGIWGRGYVYAADPRETCAGCEKAKDDCEDGGGPPGAGMPVYNFHLLLASLNIVDTPLWYQPPVGPGVAFTMTYNHRE